MKQVIGLATNDDSKVCAFVGVGVVFRSGFVTLFVDQKRCEDLPRA